MSQAVFTHDTEVCLVAAAEILNAPAPERLEEIWDYMDRWDWSGERPSEIAELAQVHRVLTRLHAIWLAPLHEAVAKTNKLLRDAAALPQLVHHEPIGWHVHAAAEDSGFATRLAVDTAMAIVDAIRAGAFERLQVCAANDCDDVYVDLSKNRSRKYCDATCGAKAHTAAYRARKARPVS